MKKLALTNLLMLIGIKFVSACSFATDSNNPDFDPISNNIFYSNVYFFCLLFLIFFNFVLFFIRKQKDYLTLTLIGLSVLVSFLVIVFIGVAESCGYFLRSILKWEVIYFIAFICLQFVLWRNKTGLHFPKRKSTIIKLG